MNAAQHPENLPWYQHLDPRTRADVQAIVTQRTVDRHGGALLYTRLCHERKWGGHLAHTIHQHVLAVTANAVAVDDIPF